MHQPFAARLLLFVMLTPAAACQRRSSDSTADGLRQAASAFMQSYAQDLRAHRREALAARYHPSGAFRLGEGRKRFLTTDSLSYAYRTRWRGPTYFAWEDLSFEPLPPTAVLVVGKFRWADTTSSDTAVYSYTGLLERYGNELRIRLEDESSAQR